LFQAYEEEIYRMAFIYVKNANDALDVVQETAYKSFKTISKLKEPRYFKTWLIRIAIHSSIDLLRQRKKVLHLFPRVEETLFVEEEEHISLTVSLYDLLNLLSEEEKSVVMLKYYQEYTLREIADILNIPVGTAKTILYRSLKKMRKNWKGGDHIGQ
jgi:RNA polymerase sigma-70 factor (ECF subfamily)